MQSSITLPLSKRTISRALRSLVLSALIATGFIATARAQTPFTLTILHNNDGESKLLGNSPAGFGGADFFVTLVKQQRAAAQMMGHAVVTISSGDNFLAGTTFTASLANGIFYDAHILGAIGYDAITLGNHDFDFGPDILADFIAEVDSNVPYISANLDFGPEPGLAALAAAGRIASAVIVERMTPAGPVQIGIIGLTTPTIATISSPRNLLIDDDVRAAAQAVADQLTASGIQHIILSSHLQGIESEKALAAQLRNVDVIIAGGGDELLANPGDLLLPGDTALDTYPVQVSNAEGRTVPIVTTTGEYRYLGRLDVQFDALGNVISATGGPVRVARNDAVSPPMDAVAPDPDAKSMAVDPVAAFVAQLANTVIGTSEVALDGRRIAVRAIETNLGNLLADAFLAAGQELAPGFGVDSPQVALTNGGGIRNDNILMPGNLTLKHTFDVSPFGNFAAIVEDVPLAVFKSILENVYSQTVGNPDGTVSQGAANTGRFAQIAGFNVTYRIDLPGSTLNPDGSVAADGSRVQNVTLSDGTKLFVNGQPAPGAPATIDIATSAFLAGGGDGYPFGSLPFTSLGVTDQQALAAFIEGLPGSLVSAAQYTGPVGRITALFGPEPAPRPPADTEAEIAARLREELEARIGSQIDSVQDQIGNARRIGSPTARAARLRRLNSRLRLLHEQLAAPENADTIRIRHQLAESRLIKNPTARQTRIARLRNLLSEIRASE